MKPSITVDTYSIASDEDSDFIKGQQAEWREHLTSYLKARHPDADLVVLWETKGKTKVKAGEGGETDEALQDLVRSQVLAAWTTRCLGGSPATN